MRSAVAVLFLILATTSVVYADVKINRELYSNVGEISESLTLKGIDSYKNDISILPAIVYESADFATEANGVSSIQRVINGRSVEGAFGSSVESSGRGLKGSMAAAAGTSNLVSFDHEIATGRLVSSSYSRNSRTEEHAEFTNEIYRSSIAATPTAVFHGGAGYGPLDTTTQSHIVSHTVEMWHNGKYTNLDLTIDSYRDEGLRPAYYSWAAAASGATGGRGISQVAASISAGNFQIDVNILGTSSELPPQRLQRHIYPLVLDETIGPVEGLFGDAEINQILDVLLRAGVSKNLYMSYTIE